MVSSTTQSQVLHQSRVRTSKLFQTQEQSYKSGWFTPPISAKIEDCLLLDLPHYCHSILSVEVCDMLK